MFLSPYFHAKMITVLCPLGGTVPRCETTNTGVVVSSYEMSSPWHRPAAERTPENMVPQVPPDLWHRHLTSAKPLQQASSQESESPRLDEPVPLFCITTHYFK